MREAVIVAMGRAAIGKAPKGKLKDTRPEDLISQVIKGVLNKVTLNTELIEELILGCAFPEAEQGSNIGRIAVLMSGLPQSVSGQTVNRFCSSGLQSIATAANAIIAGEYDIALAGGIESMSMIPIGGNLKKPNLELINDIPEIYMAMGLTAENVADKYNITREEQDIFACNSHIKASKAQEAGIFTNEIIPVEAVKFVKKGENELCQETFIFKDDEGIRKNIKLDDMSKLKAVFKNKGTVTAGSSSQTSDGAAVILLMEASKAKELGLTQIAAFRGFAVGGIDPAYMGLGPIVAIPKVLKKVGLSKEQMSYIELNEAFASQAIACMRHLELDESKININGGAIALGHPLGATGSILTVKLLNQLKINKSKYGLVSMCIGGGMGAACVFENY